MHAPLQMMFSMGLELLLSVLLAATLVYCIVLERRLASIRKGQDGLKKMIGELNGAIAGADAAETLDDRLKRARALSDELSLITNSGERIAQRFDRNVPAAPASTLPSGSVMNRLKAVR